MVKSLHSRVRTSPGIGRFLLRCIPNVLVKRNIRPIGRFAIRLRQHRMFWIRPPLTNEGFMLGALQAMVRPGDVVYDIGANIGLYDRFLVQEFKASYVYAFEPVEENLELLKMNVELGRCGDKVTVMPYAVGDEDGSTEFQVDDLSSNSGSLDAVTKGGPAASRRQYGLPPLTIKVQVRRLDTLAAGDMRKPDLIKLDIEGAEGMALAGAQSVLTQSRPRLVIELHGVDIAKSVVNRLFDLGYHCAGCLGDDGAGPYKQLAREDLNQIKGKYDLQHVVASMDPADILKPIGDYQPAG